MQDLEYLAPRHPVGIVRQFVDQVNRGDLNRMGGYFTSDHIFAEGSRPESEGRESALLHWRDVFTQSPDYHVEIIDIEELGDCVFVVGYQCTSTPGGDRAKVLTTWYARVHNQLIAEWRAYAEKEAKPAPEVASMAT